MQIALVIESHTVAALVKEVVVDSLLRGIDHHLYRHLVILVCLVQPGLYHRHQALGTYRYGHLHMIHLTDTIDAHCPVIDALLTISQDKICRDRILALLLIDRKDISSRVVLIHMHIVSQRLVAGREV